LLKLGLIGRFLQISGSGSATRGTNQAMKRFSWETISSAMIPETAPGLSQPGLSPPTILLVEDDELQRMIVTDLLRERGLTVIEAANAAAALKHLEIDPNIRMIMTDIQLTGEIDGLDLLRFIAARFPAIAMLVTSGHITPHFAELPPKARFLPKPIEPEEIISQVEELLGLGVPLR